MKDPGVAIVVAFAFLSIAAVAQRLTSPSPGPASPATPASLGGANLPYQQIGASDLVHLTVYDAPELTQSFRVDTHGNLNLPLLKAPLHAEGLMPDSAQHLTGFGSGVMELALKQRDGAFRVVYALQIDHDIWVVHAFQKKSKSGIKTPKQETDLIHERSKRLKEMLK